jgi:hypothetical protein
MISGSLRDIVCFAACCFNLYERLQSIQEYATNVKGDGFAESYLGNGDDQSSIIPLITRYHAKCSLVLFEELKSKVPTRFNI